MRMFCIFLQLCLKYVHSWIMIYLILNGWLQHSSHHAAKFLFLLPAMTHLDLALLTPYFNFTNWTSNWATSIRDQNFNFDYTAVLRLIEWSTWSTLCIWCGGGRGPWLFLVIILCEFPLIWRSSNQLDDDFIGDHLTEGHDEHTSFTRRSKVSF